MRVSRGPRTRRWSARTVASRTDALDSATIPPMYPGRPGRYDGVADVDKGSPPEICGTPRRRVSRRRPDVGTTRPQPYDLQSFGPGAWRTTRCGSSRFGNGVVRSGGEGAAVGAGGRCGPSVWQGGHPLVPLPPGVVSRQLHFGFIGWRRRASISWPCVTMTNRPCGRLAGNVEKIHPRNPLSGEIPASKVTVPPYIR